MEAECGNRMAAYMVFFRNIDTQKAQSMEIIKNVYPNMWRSKRTNRRPSSREKKRNASSTNVKRTKQNKILSMTLNQIETN